MVQVTISVSMKCKYIIKYQLILKYYDYTLLLNLVYQRFYERSRLYTSKEEIPFRVDKSGSRSR